MAFLLCLIFSLTSAITYFCTWKAMPANWLFDLGDMPLDAGHAPHPESKSLRVVPHGFFLFLFFLALTLHLSEKVALIDGFWGLSLFWLLAQIALSDFCYRLIPDQWSLGLAILGLLRLVGEITLTVPNLDFLFSRSFSFILCIIVTCFLYLLPNRLLGTPALGLGDVKLFIALALALSTKEFLTVMGSAALLGGAVAAGMMVWSWLRKNPLEQGVPYGTVVLMAAVFDLFFLF